MRWHVVGHGLHQYRNISVSLSVPLTVTKPTSNGLTGQQANKSRVQLLGQGK